MYPGTLTLNAGRTLGVIYPWASVYEQNVACKKYAHSGCESGFSDVCNTKHTRTLATARPLVPVVVAGNKEY